MEGDEREGGKEGCGGLVGKGRERESWRGRG